jgi:phosphoribosyl-AMP cyclohydrolase
MMGNSVGRSTAHGESALRFAQRISVEQVEEGHEFAPKFDRDGLIACVTTDTTSGEVLMLGYMNREAVEKTILTGEAHYWSRSRQVLWHKGATSGLVQRMIHALINSLACSQARK